MHSKKCKKLKEFKLKNLQQRKFLSTHVKTQDWIKDTWTFSNFSMWKSFQENAPAVYQELTIEMCGWNFLVLISYDFKVFQWKVNIEKFIGNQLKYF